MECKLDIYGNVSSLYEFYMLFLDAVFQKNLTSDGVQTKATSAVPRLDSVGHSAIFTLIFISSHHVQDDKAVNEDTNKMSDCHKSA